VVFECPLRDDLVLKIEVASESFQNIVEWELWQDNRDYKKVAQWLAPCEFISPCGIILAMKKTTKPTPSDYPKSMPYFLVDFKYTNFGMLDGRLVAHDYGRHRVTASTRRKKVEWWGDLP
jgi:hypothetical protein